MKRKNKRNRPKLPRQTWLIKPFDRVHESKKLYDRRKLKRELRRAWERGEW